MKITPNILSIPPYLSTSWNNITSLRVKEEEGSYQLTILLQDGPQVEIPGFNRDGIEAIFQAHAEYAETPKLEKPKNLPFSDLTSLSFSLLSPQESDGNLIDELRTAAQHNPEQNDFPLLPPTLLNKISTLASTLGLEAAEELAKPEPGCNCLYCQIMRSMIGEEEVTEEDLRFKTWDVKQTGEKLYTVTNPLDSNEYYQVFLGESVGCTCGNKQCEHIRAALST